MTKILEIESCVHCFHCGDIHHGLCFLAGRDTIKLLNHIPDWCPLKEKVDKEEDENGIAFEKDINTKRETMTIKEVYKKFKHLDGAFSVGSMADDVSFEQKIIAALWQAIKEEIENEQDKNGMAFERDIN